MKRLLKILPLVLSIMSAMATTAFADEMPSEWSLPNRGEGCHFVESNRRPEQTCGDSAYEIWLCPDPDFTSDHDPDKVSLFTPVVAYRIDGIIISDVSPGCSATFGVNEVYEIDLRTGLRK